MDPDFLSDTRVLGAASQAGIDTSHWEERRDKIRDYASERPGRPTTSSSIASGHRTRRRPDRRHATPSRPGSIPNPTKKARQ
ncbi:hypothetical protein [Streptomyces caniscabiei]|uniref:hypothetical protein n=1 Tax=Streptomyces caniscabiei TaxID=2746961 RepID=UPI0011800E56|nr:hypothetical protein [Streptomyces caniscabiei]